MLLVEREEDRASWAPPRERIGDDEDDEVVQTEGGCGVEGRRGMHDRKNPLTNSVRGCERQGVCQWWTTPGAVGEESSARYRWAMLGIGITRQKTSREREHRRQTRTLTLIGVLEDFGRLIGVPRLLSTKLADERCHLRLYRLS